MTESKKQTLAEIKQAYNSQSTVLKSGYEKQIHDALLDVKSDVQTALKSIVDIYNEIEEDDQRRKIFGDVTLVGQFADIGFVPKPKPKKKPKTTTATTSKPTDAAKVAMLKERDDKIVNYIKDNPDKANKEIALATGINASSIGYILQDLKAEGRIDKPAGGRDFKWRIV